MPFSIHLEEESRLDVLPRREAKVVQNDGDVGALPYDGGCRVKLVRVDLEVEREAVVRQPPETLLPVCAGQEVFLDQRVTAWVHIHHLANLQCILKMT